MKKGILAIVAIVLSLGTAGAVLAADEVGEIIIRQLSSPTVVQEFPAPPIPWLTPDEEIRAKEIAVSDPRVQEVLAGKSYTVVPEGRIGPWHTSTNLRKIGAVLEIWFQEPYWIEYDWPTLANYSEDDNGWPHYQERTVHQRLLVKKLVLLVDLGQQKVAKMIPVDF